MDCLRDDNGFEFCASGVELEKSYLSCDGSVGGFDSIELFLRVGARSATCWCCSAVLLVDC